VSRLRLATQSATVALFETDLVDARTWNPVLANPISLVVLSVVAGLATAPEAGGRRSVSGVVLMGYRLLAVGAPTEAFWNPGEVSYLSAQGSAAFAVMGVALGPVALQAIERQSVAQRAIATELGGCLHLPAGGAELRTDHARYLDYRE
jgi:hypothetical protein